MTINHDLAIEEYQLMNDVLMEIAQDYDTPPEIGDIALAAANEVEMQFMEVELDDADELKEQYEDFIDYMESVIDDLEDNEIKNSLLSPLKRRLAKAKKRLS
jgi:hypothetical protein